MTDSEGSLLTAAQPMIQEMSAPHVMLFYSLKKEKKKRWK
jgi:hypothetical protein